MHLLRSALGSFAFSLVCNVFWILSLSFYGKFIVYHYYSNYAKTGKVKIFLSPLGSALDSFSIYIVISSFQALVQI